MHRSNNQTRQSDDQGRAGSSVLEQASQVRRDTAPHSTKRTTLFIRPSPEPRASNNTHSGATASTEASREASAGASAGTGTSTGTSTGASAARQNEPGAAAAQRETAPSCAYGPAAAVKRPSKDDELQRQQDILPAHIKRKYQVSCMTAYGASCADLRR